jgi:hypothetical protein
LFGQTASPLARKSNLEKKSLIGSEYDAQLGTFSNR